MANAENLKKGKATQFKSGKDAVENGRKAGVASGASRRRKRAMRQAAAMLLNTQIPMNERGPFMGTVKTLLKTFGYTPDDATYQDALLAGIMLEAMKGDVRAAEFIRDTAGESCLGYSKGRIEDAPGRIEIQAGTVLRGRRPWCRE